MIALSIEHMYSALYTCYTQSMPDFLQSLKNHSEMPEDAQAAMGKAKTSSMSASHMELVQKLSTMVQDGRIDPKNSETFLKADQYNALPEEVRLTVDRMLPNIATLLTHIVTFFDAKETPNESMELMNLIDTLTEMKSRLGTHASVFTF